MQPPVFPLLHALFVVDNVLALALGAAIVLWLPGLGVAAILARRHESPDTRGLRSQTAVRVCIVVVGAALVLDIGAGVLAVAAIAGLYAADAMVRVLAEPVRAPSRVLGRWAELSGAAQQADRLPFSDLALGAGAFAIAMVLTYALALGLISFLLTLLF